MKHSIRHALLLSSLVSLVSCVGSGAPRDDTHLNTVKAYCDTLIEHGRDTYGEKHTPLFAICLDRKTHQLFPESEKERLFQIRLKDWENWGVRNSERCFTGSNPHKDQNLYQILYALSQATGEESYAKEADKTLEYFFNNLQSETTGLLAWGEHMGWSFRTDSVDLKRAAHNSTHEFGRAWALWEKSFNLAPQACITFAHGLWDHQIADQTVGNFSRHAGYFEHKTELNSEYPRHGGFFIATWAEAYRRTQDPIFLKAINVLVSGFDRRRSAQSGAVPAESNKRSGGNMIWAGSNLSLAIDTWDASEKVPSDLARNLREFCSKTDAVYLNLKHEVRPGGRGFFVNGQLDTLERFDEGPWGDNTDVWAMGGPALLCYLRYQQTKAPGYRDLVMGAAKLHLEATLTRDDVRHPADIGTEIWLMLNAHDITRDNRFLEKAEEFASLGYELFLDDTSPLPKATTKFDHYEAVTGADSLMMALLELWARKNQINKDLELTWTSR